jgi:hypothetical protein
MPTSNFWPGLVDLIACIKDLGLTTVRPYKDFNQVQKKSSLLGNIFAADCTKQHFSCHCVQKYKSHAKLFCLFMFYSNLFLIFLNLKLISCGLQTWQCVLLKKVNSEI